MKAGSGKKLEWRKVDRGRLVLYADEHPSMIALEFKPNEIGEHSKPFALHCGVRVETFAALEEAKNKGIMWWAEMHELGLL